MINSQSIPSIGNNSDYKSLVHNVEAKPLRVPVDNVMYAMKAEQAPRVPWDKFLIQHFNWTQGQHLAVIGPTGQGKTTLLINLAPIHPYVVAFATKPRDETMQRFISQGYVRIERWQSLDPYYYPKRVLWPDASSLDSRTLQREVFANAMERIFREGGWTVVIDETWYMANELKLGGYIKLFLLQARALNISLVNASQRPAYIPLEIYDQSTHLFFFRDNDEANLRRLSGISWRSAEIIRRLISDLDEHQFLYVNTRTGQMVRSRCPVVGFPTHAMASTTDSRSDGSEPRYWREAKSWFNRRR